MKDGLTAVQTIKCTFNAVVVTYFRNKFDYNIVIANDAMRRVYNLCKNALQNFLKFAYIIFNSVNYAKRRFYDLIYFSKSNILTSFITNGTSVCLPSSCSTVEIQCPSHQ